MTHVEILDAARDRAGGYKVEASRDDAERLALMLPGSDAPIAPTHWSFVSSPAWSERGGLSAAASGTAGRYQPAIRLDVPSR
jgi:hypothetical protein